jgi:polyisoprenoid-binding protein YceI
MAELADYAGTWALDPERTTIELRTKAMWVLPVKATARATGGHGTITPDGQVSGELVIDAGSLDTGISKRDDHVRTADFLDAKTHPVMTFTAQEAKLTGPGTADISGTFTIQDQTRPLTLSAVVATDDDGLVLTAKAAIDRSQWGVSKAAFGASLHNQITVTARFTKG